MVYRRRYSKRPYKRRYKRRYKRKGGAVKRKVKAHFVRRKAKRVISRIYTKRSNRSYNSLAARSKVMTFSCFLPKRAVPADNYFTDDTNVIAGEGVICGSSTGSATTNPGTLQIALQCGPVGFYDTATVGSNFKALTSEVDEVMSMYKSYRILSTKYTFTPFDSGRGLVDGNLLNTATIKNANSRINYKNLLFWSVVDNGTRNKEPTELVGSNAWGPPLAGPNPTPFSGYKYSLNSDTANLNDKTVKCRYINSSDRKSFSITVYPTPRNSPLWNIKSVIRNSASVPIAELRAGGWYQTEDWTDFKNGAWTGAQAPNNAVFGGTQQHSPLSLGCRLPQRYDNTGSDAQVPLYRVIVTQKVKFRGLISTSL